MNLHILITLNGERESKRESQKHLCPEGKLLTLLKIFIFTISTVTALIKELSRTSILGKLTRSEDMFK